MFCRAVSCLLKALAQGVLVGAELEALLSNNQEHRYLLTIIGLKLGIRRYIDLPQARLEISQHLGYQPLHLIAQVTARPAIEDQFDRPRFSSLTPSPHWRNQADSISSKIRTAAARGSGWPVIALPTTI